MPMNNTDMFKFWWPKKGKMVSTNERLKHAQWPMALPMGAVNCKLIFNLQKHLCAKRKTHTQAAVAVRPFIFFLQIKNTYTK